MTWTQPLCADCWWKENPGSEPFALKTPCQDRCCECGEETMAGIYIRRDPDSVPYPALEEVGDDPSAVGAASTASLVPSPASSSAATCAGSTAKGRDTFSADDWPGTTANTNGSKGQPGAALTNSGEIR